MRIERLRIPDYRNLHAFDIDFDSAAPITVLLGANGSGKSNLIEALVEIFRELESGRPTEFRYELTYTCAHRQIEINCDPQRRSGRLEIRVDGDRLSARAFLDRVDELLPKYVFGYYSGWSSRLEHQFGPPTRRYYGRILDQPDRELPLRRLFFCRREYSQLVLLAFFLSSDPTARSLLAKYLGIDAFESALFVLKTPWWGAGKPSRQQREQGDARFWYARGAFKGFLDRLWERALAPIRHSEGVERDVRRRPENVERLYLFVKNAAELAELANPDDDAKALFGYLESLFLCDLIDEVRVTVRRQDGSHVKFAQLSEGEQQLLTVLGLLIFTENDESLYLLDEPDTHLNPVWTYDFLDLLQQHVRVEKSQMLIATHNPLMIGNLRSRDVRILAAHDGSLAASPPLYDPIGVGVEGLLKSELYGLRSSLAPGILDKLDEHYRLQGKPDKDEHDRFRLARLAADLGELGVSRTHPNPYFERFANAMARRTPKAPPLTKEDIVEEDALADELLAEVIAEDEGSEESRA